MPVALLRGLLFSAGFAAATLLFGLLCPLLRPLPLAWRYRFTCQWNRFALWWLRLSCGIHHRVEGLEHLPAEGPALVFSKHQSAWETLALHRILPPHANVIKRELLWIPFFGWGMAGLEPISVHRGRGQEALRRVVEQGLAELRRGRWVLIFPEGTRMPPGQRGRYHASGGVLAAAAKCPVLPLAHNAGHYWPRSGWRKYPGCIRVVIGAPIEMRRRSAREIMNTARDWIESTVAGLPPGPAGEAAAAGEDQDAAAERRQLP